MAIEILYSVVSPEAGVYKTKAPPPPEMGKPPSPPSSKGSPATQAPPHTPVFSPSSTSPAKRLNTLENKTIYLVDTGYGGSYRFMQQLQKWFHEYIPSVNIIRKRKTGHVFADDTTDLWDEVKVKGDAVVLGVAG
jgi:hypothetical protein